MSDATELIDEIKFFLKSKRRNAWVESKHVALYLRKRPWILFNPKKNTAEISEKDDILDLAAFSVMDEYKGQGIITSFLDEVEKLDIILYIENVMEERFQLFFEKRGYETISVDRVTGTKCYYKS